MLCKFNSYTQNYMSKISGFCKARMRNVNSEFLCGRFGYNRRANFCTKVKEPEQTGHDGKTGQAGQEDDVKVVCSANKINKEEICICILTDPRNVKPEKEFRISHETHIKTEDRDNKRKTIRKTLSYGK